MASEDTTTFQYSILLNSYLYYFDKTLKAENSTTRVKTIPIDSDSQPNMPKARRSTDFKMFRSESNNYCRINTKEMQFKQVEHCKDEGFSEEILRTPIKSVLGKRIDEEVFNTSRASADDEYYKDWSLPPATNQAHLEEQVSTTLLTEKPQFNRPKTPSVQYHLPEDILLDKDMLDDTSIMNSLTSDFLNYRSTLSKSTKKHTIQLDDLSFNLEQMLLGDKDNSQKLKQMSKYELHIFESLYKSIFRDLSTDFDYDDSTAYYRELQQNSAGNNKLSKSKNILLLLYLLNKYDKKQAKDFNACFQNYSFEGSEITVSTLKPGKILKYSDEVSSGLVREILKKQDYLNTVKVFYKEENNYLDTFRSNHRRKLENFINTSLKNYKTILELTYDEETRSVDLEWYHKIIKSILGSKTNVQHMPLRQLEVVLKDFGEMLD